MIFVQKKLKVSIAYTVRDENYRILEEFPESHPFVYIHGYKNIVSGLEDALENKTIGESFTIHLPARDAYGPYRNDLIIEVEKEELKDVGEIWVGMEIEMVRENDWNDFQIPEYPEDIYNQSPDGIEIYIIKEIKDKTVVLDGNHPFAGKNLFFDVRILNIEEASYSELESGFPDDDNDFENFNDLNQEHF